MKPYTSITRIEGHLLSQTFPHCFLWHLDLFCPTVQKPRGKGKGRGSPSASKSAKYTTGHARLDRRLLSSAAARPRWWYTISHLKTHNYFCHAAQGGSYQLLRTGFELAKSQPPRLQRMDGALRGEGSGLPLPPPPPFPLVSGTPDEFETGPRVSTAPGKPCQQALRGCVTAVAVTPSCTSRQGLIDKMREPPFGSFMFLLNNATC